MVTVVTFLYKGPERSYTPEHVNRIARQFNYPVVCITDFSKEDFECHVIPMPKECKSLPHNYKKLWCFSQQCKDAIGGKVFLQDIDATVVADPSPLLGRTEEFVGWHDYNYPNVRWSGGNYLLETGTRKYIWESFSTDRIDECRKWHEQFMPRMVGSDQAWLSYMMPADEANFQKGIYRARHVGKKLPQDAKIVHFSGTIKPWHNKAIKAYPWLSA